MLNGELHLKFVPMIGKKSSWNSQLTNTDKVTSAIFVLAWSYKFCSNYEQLAIFFFQNKKLKASGEVDEIDDEFSDDEVDEKELEELDDDDEDEDAVVGKNARKALKGILNQTRKLSAKMPGSGNPKEAGKEEEKKDEKKDSKKDKKEKEKQKKKEEKEKKDKEKEKEKDEKEDDKENGNVEELKENGDSKEGSDKKKKQKVRYVLQFWDQDADVTHYFSNVYRIFFYNFLKK